MRGMTLLLKGLLPDIDFTTPQTALASLAPGLDLTKIQGDITNVVSIFTEMRDRQARVETMLVNEMLVSAERQTNIENMLKILVEEKNGRSNDNGGTNDTAASGGNRKLIGTTVGSKRNQ